MNNKIFAALAFLALPLLPGPAAAREPAVAGKFYPSDPEELARRVDGWLSVPKDARRPAGRVLAVIAPHAGYEFSGRVAGMSYWFLDAGYDTVVVLGTGHYVPVRGAALLASDDYSTPLGKVPTDRTLAAELIKSNPLFKDDPAAHAKEHSIEVQLPFLQRRLRKPFKLLAATLNTDDLATAEAVGRALAAALKGRKALIVISSDFSHYPPKAAAAESDGAMKLAIESLDPALVWTAAHYMLAKNIPGLVTCACGEAAIEAGMTAAKLLGAKSFAPLALSDSSAENSEAGPESVVGYMSGVFTDAGKPADLALSSAERQALLKEARRTLERVFAGEPQPAGLDPDPRLDLPGSVFVTLTEDGKLRGCVGTVEPAMTLMDAVRFAAFSAAFRDRRFGPLGRDELGKVRIEVSVLSPLTPVKAGDIKPGKEGVVVARDGHSGLFLPQVWEELPGKDAFMGELCSQKAGLPRDCWKQKGTELYSFTVDAFRETK